MGFWDFLNTNKESDVEERGFSKVITGVPIRAQVGNVDKQKAMNISSLASGVELISSTIGSLPIYLYKESKNGAIKRVKNDKREFLLNNEPNLTDGAFNFKKKIVENVLLYGKSYSVIDKQGNETNQLMNLDNTQITLEYFYNQKGFNEALKIKYLIADGSKNVQYQDDHFNFLIVENGQGVLIKNGDMLTDIIVEEETYKALLENTAQPKGVLQTSGRVSKAIADNLRETWQKIYGGSANAGKIVVLEEGLQYKQINENNASTMNKQMLDETNARRIEHILNLPSGLLSNNATSRGIGEQGTQFLSQTINPILFAIEDGLNKSLLLEDEKAKGYFFRFDTSELLRTTETEKVNNVLNMVKNGLLTINEGRSLLDKENIERDFRLLSLASVIQYMDTQEIVVPNMAQTINKDTNGGSPEDNGGPLIV